MIRTHSILGAGFTALLAATALAQGAEAPEIQGGDNRAVHFTLPFEKAQARAQAEGKPLFLKPIYGGVDRAGAEDYRCGSW